MNAAAQPNESAPFAARAPWRQRAALAASVACAGAIAVWVTRGTEPRAWLGGLVGVVGAWMGAERARRAEGRALVWGGALYVASSGPHGDFPVLDVCSALACAVCATAASFAIAGVRFAGGAVQPRQTRATFGVVAITLAWAAAIAARAALPSAAPAWWDNHPRAWVMGASAVSLVVLLTSAERGLGRRALELGVAERRVAIREILGVAVAAGTVGCMVGRATPDAAAQLTVAMASTTVGAAALHRDSVRVARVTRRVVTLVLAGGALALLAESALSGPRTDAWPTVIVVVALAVAIGVTGVAIEAPLRPSAGAWLDAFARAARETSRGEPDDVIREVLASLRAPAGLSSPSPELWTFNPPTATRVDSAGYLHEREAHLPESLVESAAAEPEGTLRGEVLAELEVRRPDLRPLAQWMADHDAQLATVVAYEGESEGLLVLPRVPRRGPGTLEELRALKAVADQLAAACRARAARARMLARAHGADQCAAEASERLGRLTHERALGACRDARATSQLARPAMVGGYAAESRMAMEAIEQRAAADDPIALVAPRGIDPVPWLARAHLAGPRRAAPLVFVDATSAVEHDVSRWAARDLSPLALADRGRLVLLDGAALPAEVQQLVARAIADRCAPWDRSELLDLQLGFTGVEAPERLVQSGRLDPSLCQVLAGARPSAIVLPRLRERVEDLHAVLTDSLAREGMAVFGRPVGIEPTAYAKLIEHTFPGEEAELGVIVQRLVGRCRGDVVRVDDVDALRLPLPGSGPGTPGSLRRRKSPLPA